MSFPNFSESVVEAAALQWFERLGYTILHGPNICPDAASAERQSYADVVLIERLRSALETINPKIPSEGIEEAVQKLTRTESPSLLENNRRFHKMLTDGVDVEYQVEGRVVYDKVWLIDFNHLHNNDWLVVNQFTVIEDKKDRRPDIVVFINGLPLGVMNLKTQQARMPPLEKPSTSCKPTSKTSPACFPTTKSSSSQTH